MKTWMQRWRRQPGRADPAEACLPMHVCLASDAGPVRPHNEDRIAARMAPIAGSADESLSLVVLADGMGGHRGGQVASALAVQACMQAFHAGGPAADGAARRRQDALHPSLLEALRAANRRIWERAGAEPALQGMGTTLVLFAPQGTSGHVAWVGDSRLYRWRDGDLQCLTRDDTLVMGMLDRGLIDADQALHHPDHAVLTQAVGTHAEIPAPHVAGPFDLREGDRLLLCSDGVHDVLDTAVLAQALAHATPEAAAQQLLALALQHGTTDNVTVGVVVVGARQRGAAPARRTRTDLEPLS